MSPGYQHLPPFGAGVGGLAHYVGQVFLDAAAVGVREEGADDVVVRRDQLEHLETLWGKFVR